MFWSVSWDSFSKASAHSSWDPTCHQREQEGAQFLPRYTNCWENTAAILMCWNLTWFWSEGIGRIWTPFWFRMAVRFSTVAVFWPFLFSPKSTKSLRALTALILKGTKQLIFACRKKKGTKKKHSWDIHQHTQQAFSGAGTHLKPSQQPYTFRVLVSFFQFKEGIYLILCIL